MLRGWPQHSIIALRDHARTLSSAERNSERSGLWLKSSCGAEMLSDINRLGQRSPCKRVPGGVGSYEPADARLTHNSVTHGAKHTLLPRHRWLVVFVCVCEGGWVSRWNEPQYNFKQLRHFLIVLFVPSWGVFLIFVILRVYCQPVFYTLPL